MLKLLYGNFLEMPKSLIVASCICFMSLPLFFSTILSERLNEYGFLFFVIFVSYCFLFYAGILLLKKSIRFFIVFFCSGFFASFSPLIYHPYGSEGWIMYLIGSFFNQAVFITLFFSIKIDAKVKEYFGR